MHNYFTNYRTPTCFDTIVSSSGSLWSISYQVTQVFQMQLLVIQCRSVVIKKKSIDLLHPNRGEVVTGMETQLFIQQNVLACDCAVCCASTEELSRLGQAIVRGRVIYTNITFATGF